MSSKVATLEQKKKDFLIKLQAFDNAVYELSDAWEDSELADLIHSNEKIMEKVQAVFPMSVDEWWHEIAAMRETVKKEFNPRLTTRELRMALYELTVTDKPILVYTNGWYYYISGVTPRAEEEGALPVIELGEAFDSRDL